MNLNTQDEETLIQENLNPEDYFVVRGQLWDPKEEDHTQEISNGTGLTRFGEVKEALEFFSQRKYEDFQVQERSDIRLELLHFRFGEPHVVKSRILFPAT